VRMRCTWGKKLAKQENICLSTVNERVAKEKVQKYEGLEKF
jgi:hypothetical protein